MPNFLVATFTSHSASETETFGRRFADQLSAGSIVALVGDLGAGKTQFARGLALGLGITDAVTSPTFTIIHEYRKGRLPVYHFDFFRLEDRARLIQLGLDDYFSGEGVSVVEWADRFPDIIPATAQWVRFTIMPGDARVIEMQ